MFSKRKSGILLHPSSLPSKYGVGDFGEEAFRWIETLADAKQTLWQILPLTPVDDFGSPYQSPSAFAGETLFINLESLVHDGLLAESELYDLPTSTTVDYAFARKVKEPLFQKAFEHFQTLPRDSDFLAFCKKNDYWLNDYAMFIAFKQYFMQNNSDFSGNPMQTEKHYAENSFWERFPEPLRKREKNALAVWSEKLAVEIEKEKFLQYIFDKQWSEIKAYANQRHIQIIGDIPIFVAYDSADVWAHQNLFLLDDDGLPTCVAGVPPDYFSATGQLWGNPLYDWTAHKKQRYTWWRKRIAHALTLTDILRLDHFRAFASYWKIPFGAKDATSGEWITGVGKAFFDALAKDFPNLPLIAEDLGLLTADVHELRHAVQLPGMRILQFAFGNDRNNAYLPHQFEPKTIVYTGTHDNNTTNGWYHNATEQEKDHFRRYLNSSGDNPAWDAIRLAFSSSAVFAIIPLQDVLGLDEDARMNTPGVADGNWKFSFAWSDWKEWQTEGLRYLSDLFGRNQNDDY